ncbi:MAG: DUF4293 family protein [Rubricoccaceae bacterium]
MIQRLQTLYLAVAAALLVLFVALASSWAVALPETLAWLAPVTTGLAILTAIVALISLALFKNRKQQSTMVLAAQWLDLLLVVAVLVGLYMGSQAADPTGRYLVALAPVVAYVLLRMARQRITKDIELVKSMDRLR